MNLRMSSTYRLCSHTIQIHIKEVVKKRVGGVFEGFKHGSKSTLARVCSCCSAAEKDLQSTGTGVGGGGCRDSSFRNSNSQKPAAAWMVSIP